MEQAPHSVTDTADRKTGDGAWGGASGLQRGDRPVPASLERPSSHVSDRSKPVPTEDALAGERVPAQPGSQPALQEASVAPGQTWGWPGTCPELSHKTPVAGQLLSLQRASLPGEKPASRGQCVSHSRGPRICWRPGDTGCFDGSSAVCLLLERAWSLGLDSFSLSVLCPLASAPVPSLDP